MQRSSRQGPPLLFYGSMAPPTILWLIHSKSYQFNSIHSENNIQKGGPTSYRTTCLASEAMLALCLGAGGKVVPAGPTQLEKGGGGWEKGRVCGPILF